MTCPTSCHCDVVCHSVDVMSFRLLTLRCDAYVSIFVALYFSFVYYNHLQNLYPDWLQNVVCNMIVIFAIRALK